MSDFLFARPSILEGLSRILDIGGTLQEYNTSNSENEADARALYNDFKAVGADVAAAAKRVESEISASR